MLALIACEQIKVQSRRLRDAGLGTELASIAAWIVGIGLGYRLVLALLLVELPSIGPALIQIAVTVLAYPLVIATTHGLMRVRKGTASDIDGKGGRS